MRFMFFSGGFSTAVLLIGGLQFVAEPVAAPVSVAKPQAVQAMPSIEALLAALDVPAPKAKRDEIGELIGGLK